MVYLILIIGKILVGLSRLFNIGSGGTWPGEIALRINPSILQFFFSRIRKGVILVSGTNGKTTTSKMIVKMIRHNALQEHNKAVLVYNPSGGNIINGVVSAFIQMMPFYPSGADWAVLEVDEATLPIILSNLKKYNKNLYIVLLNLFRDQLDRYGEVDAIARKWIDSFTQLPEKTVFVVNGDDPLLYFIGSKNKTEKKYFGLEDKKAHRIKVEHATDSIHCLFCGNKLKYNSIFFSHLGNWECRKCGRKRPFVQNPKIRTPLFGIYNEYNVNAAFLLGRLLDISEDLIKNSLSDFQPAFGRQEEYEIAGKKLKIVLAKNPAGLNATIRTIADLKPKNMLMVLNDRIPDGKDISWIWDADFELIGSDVRVIASGDRVFDLALRIKYSLSHQSTKNNMKSPLVEPILKNAIKRGLDMTRPGDMLYIIPTYTAMLEVRKILGGRKIL